jgi:nucleotide-binding universal stress UspA family protein
MPDPSEFIEQLPMRLRRILFATDFSLASAKALPFAAAIASHFRSELFVTHVIPPESYRHIAPEHLDAALTEMKEAARRRIAASLAAARFSDVSFQIVLDHGDVLSVVSALVEKHCIDWIVAGSHGRHGIPKLFSPSVDEAIAKAAACPVLIVGPEAAVGSEVGLRFERILHPTDFLPESRKAMDCAYALARAYRAKLYLLHAADNVWKEPLSTRMTAETFCRMRLLENGLSHSEPGVSPEFLVDFGPPETLILEAVKKLGIQLTVLSLPGTAHPSLSSHLPGPLAYNIASHALCPVLVVRPF